MGKENATLFRDCGENLDAVEAMGYGSGWMPELQGPNNRT